MRRIRLLRITLAALAAVGGAAACDDAEVAERPTCAQAVARAAESIEVGDQVRALDEALLSCGSYGAYIAELSSHPGLVGYSPETYLKVRCSNLTERRLRNTPACRTAHPPTTPPPATASDIVYVAATLDGHVVELHPSAAVPFAGDVPAVVQDTVDIASAQGCPGVIAQRDRWAERAATDTAEADPDVGLTAAQIASAYAQHAVLVAVWIGCPDAELAGPATTPAGATTAPPTSLAG